MKKLSQYIISEKHNAFTLVEFIVIMSIFAVMVGVVMFNFNGFRSAVTLDNLAHDIGISIRQIQTGSGASISASDSDPTVEVPRGISFSPDTDNPNIFAPEFTIFKDTNNNGIYDKDWDELIDTIKIQTQDRIVGIAYNDGSSLPAIIGHEVGITFKRYKTDARFATDEEPNLSASELIITLAAPNDSNGPARNRTITISKIGQVSIK